MPAIDRETGVDIVLGWEHHLVHDGKFFAVSAYSTAAAAANVNMMINLTAGSAEMHAVFAVGVSGQSLVTIYEGVTTSALGTTLTARNMNRAKADTVTGQYYLGATWSTNTETILYRALIPGGDSQQTRVGGSGRNDVEWILAPNKKYLFNILNQAASTITATINLTFYEMAD